VIVRTKSARNTSYLLVSLGVGVAMLMSSVMVVTAGSQRAYAQVMPPSLDSSATATTTAEVTATVEATVAVVPTTSVEITTMPALPGFTVAPPPVMTAPARPATVMVPSVLGKTKAVAVKRLKSRKLKVKMTRAYSSRKPGTVISQTPVRKRRAVGSTVRIKIARRWPSGFKTKAASDRFWRPYVVASYKEIQRSRRYRGSHRVYTTANVNMTLRAIWGESRGAATAGLKHHDGYLGLLQMSKGYGSKAQRLDPVYSIKRMGRGIKTRGASWARARWSTI
jgi:hypothetical protein